MPMEDATKHRIALRDEQVGVMYSSLPGVGQRTPFCYAANIPTVPALRNHILNSDLADEFSLNEIYDSV
ncbi:hypothetical protein H0E87_027753 [Populus deltoides]|uniref:Uncharacterized protein n=1 Tax=Populus deltoides TaxID=3696 RepID=A0A8T2WSJ6_POPDE|nr:hypothetical protein H0E87_027753 [Populus deltoides]